MYIANRPTPDRTMGFPIIAAISAAVSAASAANSAGLFSGKIHTSPWGFVYDDYPLKIYEAEVAIKNLRDAINEARGLPPTPALPPPPTRTGSAQYQTAMLAIVPKYAPGWEDEIAAYNRTLNETGGGYELTYGKQQEVLQQLIMEARALQATPASPVMGPAPLRPDLYSPASPVGGVVAPSPYTPRTALPPGVSPSPTPYIYGQQRPGMSAAGMFGPGEFSPLLIGGLALAAVAVAMLSKRRNPSANE